MLRSIARWALFAAAAYLLVVAAMFALQRQLIYPAPDRAPPLPAGFERLVLRNAPDLRLEAAWREPAPGMPTVVFLHGNGDSWQGGAAATEALAQEGLGVLLAGYRGYSDNSGDPDESGLYADGAAALDWLNRRGLPDRRVIIIGNSLGSGVATELARKRPPAALILVSPFTSMADVAARQYPWLPVRWLLLDRYDNLAKIDAVSAPVLILHGTADRLIPVAQARRLAAAHPAAALRLFEGAGHGLAYDPPAQAAQVQWLGEAGLVPRR
jgi:fermentation-respiration switch protein FrsA (DUF1100 family)